MPNWLSVYKCAVLLGVLCQSLAQFCIDPLTKFGPTLRETWGAGVDIHPSCTFSVSNPFFGSICTK